MKSKVKDKCKACCIFQQFKIIKVLIIVILLFSVEGYSQESREVKGVVVSAKDNMPLPGVSILVKGTNKGTVSGFDGDFNVMVSESGTLVFSYLGYKTKEVAVGGQTVVNVSLEEDLNSLDEVVVVGYGTVKKSDLTGAVTGIKSDDIVQSKSTSFLEAMQGRMSGVQVKQQSGEPGAGIDIKIRGANSVNASSNPLYVIDGVQIDIDESEVATSTVGNSTSMNPLATLNPNDIQSIEVLKDASATAIYGSRGANGVVIVTTKGGKSKKATFSYSTYVSFSDAANKLDMLSGEDYIEYRKQIDFNNNDNLLWIDTDGDDIVDTPRDLSEIKLHDWQDEALRTAFTQSHHLSVSGGNENTKYSSSVGYLDQDGIVVNNNYKRFNFRVKIDQKISEKFNVGVSLTSAYSEQSGATSSGGPGEFNGVLQSLVLTKPVEFFDPNDFEDLEFGRFISPVNLILNSEKNISLSRTIANVDLQYNFTKKLSFKLSGGGNISDSKGKEFYGTDTRPGARVGGRGVLQQRLSRNYFATSQFNYRLRLNKENIFRFLLGAEYNFYNKERLKIDGAGFADESTGVNDISKASVLNEYSSDREEANRISYFGRVNYSLKDRYLFTGTLRRDGSDKFGPGNKWGVFPSAALAWKVSEENFLKENSALSNLKLRLGYGVTGNERIPPYSYYAQLGNTFTVTNGSTTLGLAPVRRSNPNLKWETTTQYNLGVDIGLFNDRISLTADVYDKKTEDMLLLTPLTSQSGFFEEYSNVGSISNKGVELGLTSYNISKSKFTWTTNFNISTNKNKVVSLGASSDIPVIVNGGFITNVGIVKEGEPIGAIYGYEWDGVYQIDDFTWQNNSDTTIPFEDRVFVLKDGEVDFPAATVQPGSFKFRDLNGDGVVDSENDKKVLGNSYPELFGGINNSISFGDFDFEFFLDWQYGNEIFNEVKYRMEGRNTFNLHEDFFKGRWTPDNPTNDFGTTVGENRTAQQESSYYVEDGSYLRLSNVTFGYNMPKDVLEGLGIKSLRLYLTGTNLKTWTSYSGYDPDISFNNPLLTGFDRTSYPRSRSLIFGVNMTF